MRDTTILAINNAVEHARKKHPQFSENDDFKMFALLGEEKGELAKELNEHNHERARAEALDCIAVLVRFLEND